MGQKRRKLRDDDEDLTDGFAKSAALRLRFSSIPTENADSPVATPLPPSLVARPEAAMLSSDLTSENPLPANSDELLEVTAIAPPPPPTFYMLQTRSLLLSDAHFIGLLLMRGSYHLAKRQYVLIQKILRTKSGKDLPTYHELHSKTRTHVSTNCFPIAREVEIPPSSYSTITRPGTKDHILLIVPPSQWAIHDLSFRASFRQLYETLRPDDGRSVESTRMIRDRESITRTDDVCFVHGEGFPMRIRKGSRVRIRTKTDRDSEEVHVHELHAHDVWVTSFGNKKPIAPTCSLRTAVRSLFATSCVLPPDHPTSEVLPGDMCVLLSASADEGPSTVYSLLIRRFWRYSTEVQEAVLFLCLDIRKNLGNSYEVHNITTPVVVKIGLYRTIEPPLPAAPLRGELMDGRKYIVYRMLLYADDFKPFKSSYSRGQVGGVYMMPLGLSTRDKFSPSSIRCISLAPLGVNSNVVLSAIMDDIIKGATDGIPVRLPDGEDVYVFLDFVAFVADYPAASKLIDVNGQAGLAPCTHCTFIKYCGNDHRTSSRYARTTSVHSQNSSAVRSRSRHDAMNAANLSHEGYQRLGMNKANTYDQIRCPLHYFERKLHEERHKIPSTRDGRPVVPHTFCPYQSQTIGTDHVLNGITLNCITACAYALPPVDRKEFDCRIRHELKANGLVQQSRIFNHKGGSEFGMYSLSFSDCACIFSIICPVVRVMFKRFMETSTVYPKLLAMIEEMHTLVGLTYFWPQPSVDPQEDYEYFVGSGRSRYLADLLSHAQKLLQLINDISKLNLTLRSIIDKPNVHRLYELYVHTIPAFGHCRQIQELTFEHGHQALKRVWEHHNGKENHISAVQESLFNDYFERLFNFRKDGIRNNLQSHPEYMSDMFKLLLGRDAEYSADDPQMVELAAVLESMFTKEVDTSLEMRSGEKLKEYALNQWSTKQFFLSALRSSRRSSRTSIPKYDKMQSGSVCRVLLAAEAQHSRLLKPSITNSSARYFVIIQVPKPF